MTTFGASVQHACRLAGFSRTAWYRPGTAQDQTALRMRIREIAFTRQRFGASRICTLLRREGWHVNRKRVHRLYRLEGLQVRMRVKRRKHMALHRGPAPIPTGRGQRWSMDFVHDALMSGRAFRVLTTVDQWSRCQRRLKLHTSADRNCTDRRDESASLSGSGQASWRRAPRFGAGGGSTARGTSSRWWRTR